MRQALTALAIAVLGCGGAPGEPRAGEGRTAAGAEPPSPLAGAGWREVVPAGATLLFGADVPRLIKSEAVRELLPAVSADGAEIRRTLESAAAECGLGFPGDLDEVVVASFGPREPNAVAVATGRFEAATIARCMDVLLALRGSAVEHTRVGGMPALRGSRAGDNAWAAVPSEGILVLAGTRAWLARTLDHATPRLANDRSLLPDLLASLPSERSLWAAGLVAPDSEPARLAHGVAGAPMDAFYGYAELGEGLRVELGAVMKTPEGAEGIVDFLRSYMDSSEDLLKDRGLAPYAAKLDLATRGEVAQVSLALDRVELEQLLGGLGAAPEREAR